MKYLRRNVSVISFYLLMCLFLCPILYGFGNEFTHPAITEKAISSAILNDYLKIQLGFDDGLSAQLYWDFPSDIKERMGKAEPDKTTRSILDWLRMGSIIEDEDGRYWPIRPRHHFHDPIRNAGLDNQTDHPNWQDYACTKTGFDLTGESALHWAAVGTAEKKPTTNNHYWGKTREEFYKALTESSESAREESLAKTFLNLGHVLHLLEDMGVPAHARNDFLFGHYRSWYDKGNPLETWVEEQVEANGGQCPWAGSGPVVFDKLTKYFDADTRDPNDYLGGDVSPPGNWGLAECTNYQFLSKREG